MSKHLHPHPTAVKADAKERLDWNQSEKVHDPQRWGEQSRDRLGDGLETEVTGADTLVVTGNSQALTPWQIVAVREAIS